MRTTPRSLTLCLCLGLTLGALLPALASADDDNLMPATGTDSFRCGNGIVEDGMPLAKVQEMCGAPTQQMGDRWIYDRGPDKFTIIIHVEADNTVGMIEEQAPK